MVCTDMVKLHMIKLEQCCKFFKWFPYKEVDQNTVSVHQWGSYLTAFTWRYINAANWNWNFLQSHQDISKWCPHIAFKTESKQSIYHQTIHFVNGLRWGKFCYERYVHWWALGNQSLKQGLWWPLRVENWWLVTLGVKKVQKFPTVKVSRIWMTLPLWHNLHFDHIWCCWLGSSEI